MKLKIWQKLTLIAVVMGIAIPVLVFLFAKDLVDRRSFAEQQLLGVEYLPVIVSVQENMAKHRGETAAVLGGATELAEQLELITTDVETTLSSLETLDKRLGGILKTENAVSLVRAQWDELKAVNLSLDAEENFARHTAILDQFLDLRLKVAENSGFLFHTDIVPFELSEVIFVTPALIEDYGQLRGISAGIAARTIISREERVRLAVLEGRSVELLNIVTTGVNEAVANSEVVAQKLSYAQDSIQKQQDFLKTIESDFVNANVIDDIVDLGAEEIFSAGTGSINFALQIYGDSLKQIDRILNENIADINRNLAIAIAVSVLFILLALVVVYFVSRGIINQLGSILNVFNAVRNEDLTVRADIVSGDELGSLAEDVNTTVDDVLALNTKVREDAAKVEEEYNRAQESIIKLLDEVSGIADGDLTKEAEVTAEVTGAIADSFNNAIVELRRIITEVQSASSRVNEASTDIKASMDRLSQGSEEQSGQIIDTTAAIDEMAISIRQVSENASMSATVAQQALSNAKQGAEVVENTIEGMNNIRDQVQETSKRIKRLGESSQEIGEITQLIGEIADRTSILALNASIQAAMAGEAGRGFAVVAEEVERLADRATDSTKRIETLIKTIQAESNDAISAMEDMTNEVVSGSERAADAGKVLGEIESVSVKLADLIQSISMAAQQQARGSETIANAMSDISMVTQQSTLSTREAFTTSAGLTELSEELGKTISAFKLPETNGASAGVSAPDIGMPTPPADATTVSGDGSVQQ